MRCAFPLLLCFFGPVAHARYVRLSRKMSKGEPNASPLASLPFHLLPSPPLYRVHRTLQHTHTHTKSGRASVCPPVSPSITVTRSHVQRELHLCHACRHLPPLSFPPCVPSHFSFVAPCGGLAIPRSHRRCTTPFSVQVPRRASKRESGRIKRTVPPLHYPSCGIPCIV